MGSTALSAHLGCRELAHNRLLELDQCGWFACAFVKRVERGDKGDWVTRDQPVRDLVMGATEKVPDPGKTGRLGGGERCVGPHHVETEMENPCGEGVGFLRSS